MKSAKKLLVVDLALYDGLDDTDISMIFAHVHK